MEDMQDLGSAFNDILILCRDDLYDDRSIICIKYALYLSKVLSDSIDSTY